MIRCELFDSTPSAPHRKCKREATAVLRNVMTGATMQACPKHVKLIAGNGAWIKVSDPS